MLAKMRGPVISTKKRNQQNQWTFPTQKADNKCPRPEGASSSDENGVLTGKWGADLRAVAGSKPGVRRAGAVPTLEVIFIRTPHDR